MRAVWTLGTINAAVLLAAVGVVVGEHLAQHPTQVALAASDTGHPAAERASDTGHPAAGRTPADDDDDEEQQPEQRTAAEDDDDEEQQHEQRPAPPEMGRAAEVVAACESGKRRAHGTPVLGTHRWHITNDHGGTDSGAFQFVDATWHRVASEIGASQFGRAKDAPPEVQLEAFRWLWRRNPEAWNASRSCWGPLLHQ